ncbi:phosphate signaling complex protein PhoU [Chakrabartyella piscis]|uniref:phosphate signaling complex protein PhoU n=1 Tax=Chakrabartyella piscis TaxID=2918914 RepID=UPI0029586179|nr:phosphate signaling complex protein PhoU [Chakrabartyella piscis]
MGKNRFELQLDELHVEMIKMGALCEEAITYAIQMFFENDAKTLEIVRNKEIEIDRKEQEIESLCMRLLLKQQPVARDLRIISSTLRIISDMERIGDQALDIAEITGLPTYLIENNRLHIQEMAKETIQMVTKSIDAFVKNDLTLIEEVKENDDVLDELFRQIKNELIALIGEDKYQGEFYLDMLMIAKYLERIGDHATNIVEWVEYSILGHRGKGI